MASAILQQIGASVTFSSTGDVLFSPASTPFGEGWKSDLWDRGASPQSADYSWRAKTKLASGTIDEVLELYMATSDGTIVDGTISPGDANLPSSNVDALKNMLYMGKLIVDKTGSISIQSSGNFTMTERYGVLVFWNATTASTLTATASDHAIIIKPVYPEAQ